MTNFPKFCTPTGRKVERFFCEHNVSIDTVFSIQNGNIHVLLLHTCILIILMYELKTIFAEKNCSLGPVIVIMYENEFLTILLVSIIY